MTKRIQKPQTKPDNYKSPHLSIWPVMTTARRLDLIANFELAAGHTRRAEFLSHLAADIREVGQ